MVREILMIVIGTVLGFVIASGTIMSILRGKGYHRFNDIPAKAPVVKSNQPLADELAALFDYSIALREKHGLFVDKMTMTAKFSDGTKQTFDIFKLASDCIKNNTQKSGSLIHAVYAEMLRLKTSKEDN